jgi:hypothetical protein
VPRCRAQQSTRTCLSFPHSQSPNSQHTRHGTHAFDFPRSMVLRDTIQRCLTLLPRPRATCLLRRGRNRQTNARLALHPATHAISCPRLHTPHPTVSALAPAPAYRHWPGPLACRRHCYPSNAHAPHNGRLRTNGAMAVPRCAAHSGLPVGPPTPLACACTRQKIKYRLGALRGRQTGHLAV